MVTSALKRLPELAPPTRPLTVQDLPWRAAANDNVVEGFASKFLRIGGKVLGHALFYAQFLEFEGDTAHHAPVVDRPPEGKTVPQWLSEMEEMSRIAAEIYAIQQQISSLDQRQQGHLAYPLRLRLNELLAQSQVIMQGNGIPMTSGALAMVASAGGASSGASGSSAAADKKLEPVDWKGLAATGDTDRYVAVAKRRIRQVSEAVYADINAGKNPPEVLAWYTDVAQPDLTAIYELARDLPMTNAAGEAWHNTRNHLTAFIPYSAMVLEDGNVNEIREFFAPPKEGLDDIVAKVVDRHKSRATFDVRGLDGIQISPSADPEGWTELLDNLVRNAIEHPQPGRKVHIVIQYNNGVLRVEDNAKGMSQTFLAALLGGQRTHNGVVLDEGNANSGGNQGHGYGAGLIQKFAANVGARAEYVSQEGEGTTVSLTPIQDAIFAPDAMAFVMQGKGDFTQFQYLLERMPADKRVEILRKLSTIMMAVGNDVFPRLQMAIDPDARQPGRPVPSLMSLKQELGGIVERYLRFFNIVAAGRIMAGYEEVVDSCRQGAHILMALLRATSPKTASAPLSSDEWDEDVAFGTLLSKIDTFIATVRRTVADRLDRGDYHSVILEWYEATICPQIVRLQVLLDGIHRTDELMPILLDAQRRLMGLLTLIPMYLTSMQLETARVLAMPSPSVLSTMFETIQTEYANRVRITQIDTFGLRVAPGTDFKKWEALVAGLIRALATHPQSKGTVVRITVDMSTGALVVKSDDTLNEYAPEWDEIWEMGNELGIVVENDRTARGTLATLVFPDGFLEPDPFQFVLGAQGDVGVFQLVIDAMSEKRREALLKEMDVVADRLADQALSQALDVRLSGASKPYLQALQFAVTRFEVMAAVLIEGLSQKQYISRGLDYTIGRLRAVAQNPEGLL